MIKNENGIFFITGGNACYSMRVSDGELYHVCFGKRVEYEDDMTALTVCEREIYGDDIVVKRGGKRIGLKLAVVNSRVESKPVAELPTLRGDKTLVVELYDKAAGVKVFAYYTPYTRSGIAKRLRIVNAGDTPLTVERFAAGIAAGCDFNIGGRSPAFAVGGGGAIGAFPLYPISCATTVGRRMVAAAIDKTANGENVRLEAGDSVASAEVLAVYSESVGGAIRAFHDIIREYGVSPNKAGKRRPIVLYLDGACGDSAFEKSVDVACEIGIDTVAVEYGSDIDLAFAADCVHRRGAKFGLKITDAADVVGIRSAIEKCGADYLEFGFGGMTSYSDVVGMYGAYRSIVAEFPDLVADIAADGEASCDLAELKSRALSPVPLAAVRNTVAPDGGRALKTSFDIASLGGLSYRFDPLLLDAAATRAVRAQIFSYQDDAGVIHNGDVYDVGGGIMTVSKDKSKAYVVAIDAVRLIGLDEHNIYHVRELGKTFSGAALMYYGLPKDERLNGETVTYHIRQVADYD